MERLSLIDVSSSEDDLLIFTSPQSFANPKPAGCQERGNLMEMSNQVDHLPEMSESPERKQKSGKFNLRKSLAWDNAFFTSEGVLDPEELAVVNSTFRKTELHTLPGIQEDTRTSADSTSTLDNDSWALENFEIGLFENLRASIQKSYGNCNKSSSIAHCSRTRESEKSDVPQIGSSSKAEPSSQNMIKPPNALKRHGVSKQRLEGASKEASLCPKVAATKTENSKSLLRPPRITSRASPLPTVPSKRNSESGNIQLRSNTSKALSGNATDRQSLLSLKKPHLDTCAVVPRSFSSPKSSDLSVGILVRPPVSYSSHKNSNSGSSDSKGQSTMKIPRTKIDSKYSSSCLNSKAPLRASKSKIGTRNASNSMIQSSSVSPASSIDSVASESSSASTVLKTSVSRGNSNMGSSSSSPSFAAPSDVPQPSAVLKFSTGPSFVKNGNCGIPQSQYIAKTTSAINVPSLSSGGDHARLCISNSLGSKCSKPSGLRMPSLKFGYFDAEKTLVQNSGKHSQTGMDISLLKTTKSINISKANKPKSSNLHSLGPGAQDATLSCDSPQTQSMKFPCGQCIKDASPTSPQLSEPAEVQVTSKKTASKCNSCSKGNKDSSPMTGKGNYHKDYNKAVDKVDCGYASNLSIKEDAEHSNHMSVTSDLSSIDRSVIFSESSKCDGIIHASYQVGEEGIGHLENDVHSVAISLNIGKENLIPEDQTGALSKHFKNEKLDLETVELLGKKVHSICLDESKDKDSIYSGGLESSTCPMDNLAQKKFNLRPNLPTPS